MKVTKKEERKLTVSMLGKGDTFVLVNDDDVYMVTDLHPVNEDSKLCTRMRDGFSVEFKRATPIRMVECELIWSEIK